ncbi:MAG: type II toxin-antitoxin system VapC family toxin [Streptosporangiaceae bacterium]
MTCVVDCSIVTRLLASKPGDELLRQRLARTVHAPALIDAEVSSVVRGLSITAKPEVQISAERALEMLADYAGLRIVRHPTQPLQARVIEMRHNLTAYDGMYVALAESLGLPLLTDDGKLAAAPGHTADVHQYPN